VTNKYLTRQCRHMSYVNIGGFVRGKSSRCSSNTNHCHLQVISADTRKLEQSLVEQVVYCTSSLECLINMCRSPGQQEGLDIADMLATRRKFDLRSQEAALSLTVMIFPRGKFERRNLINAMDNALRV